MENLVTLSRSVPQVVGLAANTSLGLLECWNAGMLE
jgi:hypothetical protein